MIYRNVKEMIDDIRGRTKTFTPKVADIVIGDPDFEGMKKSELEKYAGDLGLDIPSKTTKADIIKAIKEAE